MPIQYWKHTCAESGGTVRTTRPLCPDCGEPQEYDGWHLGMYERMAVYQYVYGLKPMGPHSPLVERRLTPLRLTCRACAGRGLRAGRQNERWSLCPACEGTGGTWTCSSEEVEAIRREIMRAFPDAEVAHTPRNFVSPTLALKLATGCVVELTEETE
jgi:hypothetical protein